MRAPDINGIAGKAWRGTPADARIRVAEWLVHAPTAHPAWKWYAVSLIALRDIPPGVKWATEEMTHEVMIVALDPAWTPDDNWSEQWAPRMLSPVDLCEVLPSLTDERAVEVTRLLVDTFCRGLSAPDSDFRHQNAALLKRFVIGQVV